MIYFKEIIKKNKSLVFIYIIIGISIAFLTNIQAKFFQVVIDRFTQGSLKIGTIIIYAAIMLTLCIINYLDEYPSRKLENDIYLDFKLNALSKIQRISYEAYQLLGTGKLVQKVENGADAGKSILYDYVFCLLRELIPSVLFSMFFIYKIDKRIMLVILCGYVLVFLITNILLKFLYQIKEHILVNEEKLNHFLVRGFMELVVFRLNNRFLDEIKKANNAKNEIVHSKVKMKMIHEAFFASFALLITFVKIAILVYGWKTKSISIGAIVALLSLVDNAYTPIAIFNVLFVQYKLDKIAFKRYTDFLNADEDTNLFTGKYIGRLKGDIRLNEVAFSYQNKVIMQNINLAIKSGEMIGIVGESGSGKSTFIKLLLGLLKPKEGQIFVDNKNLSEIHLETYYDNIAYISQEAPVFDGTLRENIVFDQVIEEANILEVLEKVHLMKLYHSLPDGLETRIGERGICLSGGERQRLALARLWFKNPSIVILDEATSAMDNITEDLVLKNVMVFLKNKTVIVIAHRIHTIQEFNRILVFRQGRIMGDGSLSDLLLENEYFRKLYEAKMDTDIFC